MDKMNFFTALDLMEGQVQNAGFKSDHIALFYAIVRKFNKDFWNHRSLQFSRQELLNSSKVRIKSYYRCLKDLQQIGLIRFTNKKGKPITITIVAPSESIQRVPSNDVARKPQGSSQIGTSEVPKETHYYKQYQIKNNNGNVQKEARHISEITGGVESNQTHVPGEEDVVAYFAARGFSKRVASEFLQYNARIQWKGLNGSSNWQMLADKFMRRKPECKSRTREAKEKEEVHFPQIELTEEIMTRALKERENELAGDNNGTGKGELWSLYRNRKLDHPLVIADDKNLIETARRIARGSQKQAQ
jgi:hypothetical protein